MPTTLRLVSLNIERSKHLDLVIPFLEKANAEVVCLQELMERDISLFEKTLGMRGVFAPMTVHPSEGMQGIMGIGIFSRLPVQKTSSMYYVGSADVIPNFETITVEKKHAINHALVTYTVEKEGISFTVATTHFTWTPRGYSTDDGQRRDVQELLKLLEHIGEFVLCGDFNAARGGEIFSTIASVYEDNVPLTYTTSIDGNFHRAGQLPYMVDGLFSTKGYAVSGVEIVCGVSDHCALITTISKG